MLLLVGASALSLLSLQASIAAPTDAFRACLREASTKATNEKVSADGIEAYLRTACSVQMDTLKSAVVAFRIKNGMKKAAAAEDASMTVDDYIAAPVDKYKFIAGMSAPAAQPAAATAPAQQTAPATQPPKQ